MSERQRGDTPALDVLLAAAVRQGAVDADGEARAVAAFRATRERGVHRARTRRRDDWRPRERRRAGRSVRATLAVLLVSVTLGGVAVAAIGASSEGGGDERGRARPSASDSEAPATESVSPHPPTAGDTAAHQEHKPKKDKPGKQEKKSNEKSKKKITKTESSKKAKATPKPVKSEEKQ